MDRHFLVTVSDQKGALCAVRFVADFFSDKQRVKASLFYSAPKPPAVFGHERSLEADRRQKEQQRKIIAKGKKALDQAKLECLASGFEEENVIIKMQEQIYSKVDDIIHEGEKGNYDAVVLGRRGLSMLEEMFEDSVSSALFNERFSFPLWLCCSSDAERKNVLFYVDGSEPSFKMADHIGFISTLEKKQRIDILPAESITDQPSLMDQYKKILINHGLPEEMIRILTLKSGNPANQILERVAKQKYAAVAIGKSSTETNILARLFKGPVCSALFKDLKDAALWICP